MRLMIGALCAAVLFSGSAAAQQTVGATGAADRGDEKQVTLSGCVVKGKNGGALLTDVVVSPNAWRDSSGREVVGTSGSASIAPSQIVYWLDEARKLRKHAGQRVLVTGELEGNFERGQVAVERDKRGMIELDVEYGGRKVTGVLPQAPETVLLAMASTPAAGTGAVGTSGPVGTSGAPRRAPESAIGDQEIDLRYSVRRIDVKSIEPASGACR